MKKQLMLLLLFACSLVAKAQFVNPFKYDNGKGLTYAVNVYAMTPKEERVTIPQDTIMETNQLGFMVAAMYHVEKERPGDDFFSKYTFNGQVKDYYRRDMGSNPEFGVSLDLANVESDLQVTIPSNLVSTELGGHFYWEWKDSIEGFGQKGHIQMNMNPYSAVYGKNGNTEKLYEYRQLDISAKIRTGFPYDIANYQGITKYSVYDPDSTLICTKEIPLRMSADSTMNGQVQEDLICTVDSARKGTYRVVMDGPFLEKPTTWKIEVIDPLKDASSRDYVDATYRLKESDFKSEGKGKGWNCSGNINPTYFNGEVDNAQYSAMVVRSQGYEGNGFSLTQEIQKMPSGFYKLSWPVVYQPCDVTKIEGKEPVLAEIEVNGLRKKAKHILAVADQTKNDDEGTITLVLPQSDKALAVRMNNAELQDEITFEVKEDSVISIGVHKSHGTLDDEITAISAATLKYYGAGLPYGIVTFDVDSITYAAGDSIKTIVNLFDGVGKPVPEDNTIDLIFCKKLANGNFDTENPVISKQLKAPKKDRYDMSIKLPEGAEQLADGTYLMLVASLKDEKDFLLFEQKTFEIGTAAAINGVIAEPTANTVKGNADKNIYNLAGMKVANSNQAKGIYIKGKKKVARR